MTYNISIKYFFGWTYTLTNITPLEAWNLTKKFHLLSSVESITLY